MADEPSRTAKLQFHYIKSPDYREVGCDGVLGGVTPRRKIVMSLFSERGPIPRLVEYDLHVSGDEKSFEFDEGFATPSHIDTRHGIVRHVEVTSYLDVDVARRLQKWLGDRIAEIEGGDEK